MEQRFDVAVIGAGIVGTSSALHLLMRGKKVALIDRKGAGRETSYGNAGMLESSFVLPYAFPPLGQLSSILLGRNTAARAHYDYMLRSLPWLLDFYRQSRPAPRSAHGKVLRSLMTSSVDEHRFLMRGTEADRHLHFGGHCRLYRTPASFAGDASGRKAASEIGVPFEIIDAAAFREREPDLRPVFHKVVRWTGSARLDNPGAVVASYAERFAREGGNFVTANVTGLKRTAENWSVETSAGALSTKEIVVCAGPWANDTLKPLGYHFPLGFKRGYHLHYRAQGNARLSSYISDADIGCALVPMEQGYRLVTGAEFADIHAPPTPVQLDRVLPAMQALFPLGEPIGDIWMGSRPCFADSLPVIGRAARHEGLWFNLGHGHNGLTIGPGTGRLLAEIMTGEKPFCDPAPYSASRFNC